MLLTLQKALIDFVNTFKKTIELSFGLTAPVDVVLYVHLSLLKMMDAGKLYKTQMSQK